MGVRRRLRELGGEGNRPSRARTRDHALRHGRAIRFRAERADTRRGAWRRPRIDLPRDEDPAHHAGRAGRGAARRRKREPDRRPQARSVPGAPTQSGRARRHDHARHESAATHRPGRRGWCQQLFAKALGSRVLSNQVRYSLADRRPERDLVPYAHAHRRMVIAYSPLAQGLLSGRYDKSHRPANSVRRGSAMFLPENLERAAGLISALRHVAESHSATPSQIALAWLTRDPVVVAIPGASSVAQLEDNAAAADIDLSDEEYQALSEESRKFAPVTWPAALPGMIGSRLRRQ